MFHLHLVVFPLPVEIYGEEPVLPTFLVVDQPAEALLDAGQMDHTHARAPSVHRVDLC